MKAAQYLFFAILGVAAALAFAVFPRPGHAAELLKSTPLYSTQSVVLPSGEQGYQVECHGLLESGEACAVEARHICDTVKSGSRVRPLLLSQPLNTIDRSPEPDYRSIMFQCASASENGNESK